MAENTLKRPLWSRVARKVSQSRGGVACRARLPGGDRRPEQIRCRRERHAFVRCDVFARASGCAPAYGRVVESASAPRRAGQQRRHRLAGNGPSRSSGLASGTAARRQSHRRVPDGQACCTASAPCARRHRQHRVDARAAVEPDTRLRGEQRRPRRANPCARDEPGSAGARQLREPRLDRARAGEEARP